jgi:hypothetical protein
LCPIWRNDASKLVEKEKNIRFSKYVDFRSWGCVGMKLMLKRLVHVAKHLWVVAKAFIISKFNILGRFWPLSN